MKFKVNFQSLYHIYYSFDSLGLSTPVRTLGPNHHSTTLVAGTHALSRVHIQGHWRFGNPGSHVCFESLVGFAFVVIVFHILEVGEGSLSSEGIAFATWVIVQFRALDGQDVWLAVLVVDMTD